MKVVSYISIHYQTLKYGLNWSGGSRLRYFDITFWSDWAVAVAWDKKMMGNTTKVNVRPTGPGNQPPFHSSFHVFKLQMMMTHLAGSSSQRTASVLRELRLQWGHHHGSRQLVDKAPHSIMDDQNSWLCMYDNRSLLYPLHQGWLGGCGSQRPRLQLSF